MRLINNTPSRFPTRLTQRLLPVLFGLLLSACGGSGGDASSQVQGGAAVVQPVADLTLQADSRDLIAMNGEWRTWSDELTGIYQDAESGYLVIPAVSSGQDYIYGVQEFPGELVAGSNYRLELVSEDSQAKVLMFLRDGNGLNVPLTEVNGDVKEYGSITGAGSLLFTAPADVTGLLMQVQAGWRGDRADSLAGSANRIECAVRRWLKRAARVAIFGLSAAWLT